MTNSLSQSSSWQLRKQGWVCEVGKRRKKWHSLWGRDSEECLASGKGFLCTQVQVPVNPDARII